MKNPLQKLNDLKNEISSAYFSRMPVTIQTKKITQLAYLENELHKNNADTDKYILLDILFSNRLNK